MRGIGESSAPHRRAVSAFAAAFLLALAGFLALTPAPAGAQEPAICEQYDGLPQCLPNQPDDPDDGDQDDGDDGDQSNDPGASGGDGDDVGAGGLPGSGTVPPAGVAGADAGGELPFTGYPLTPLIWILLALLLCGLALRAYLAIRERLRSRSAATPA